MKVTWNLALAAAVVLGCVVTWTFAQQLGDLPTAAAPSADNGAVAPVGAPPAAGAAPTPVIGFGAQPPLNEDVEAVIEVTPDGHKVRTLRSRGLPRGYASSGGYAVSGAGKVLSQPDPEMAKLDAVEEEAAKEAQTIVAKLRTITDDKGDVEDTKKLRDALARQFDAQQQRRALEIGKIEERLGRLKETMKRRESAKDTIIGRRVDELKGITDDLGWEETKAPHSSSLPPGASYGGPRNTILPRVPVEDAQPSR